MKKKYTEPKLEICELCKEDVIVTSYETKKVTFMRHVNRAAADPFYDNFNDPYLKPSGK